MDHQPSALWCHSPADSHCPKSPRWGSHRQIPSTTTSQSLQTSAWDAADFLHLSSMNTPNQKSGCHHWSVRLWILQWEASGKPWIFDLDCTLLMKSSISQLKAASTPSSPHVPSYLPTPFLCILILCMSEDCGKCEFFRLPYYGHYRSLHYHHCRRNFVALQFKCSHFKTGSRGSEDHDQITPPTLWGL